MNRTLKATIVISLLRILDLITTIIALNKFGVGIEQNKLVVLFLGIIGNVSFGLIIYFILSTIFLYYVLKLIDYLDKNKKVKEGKKNKNLFRIAYIFLIVIFCLVPIWNLINILV